MPATAQQYPTAGAFPQQQPQADPTATPKPLRAKKPESEQRSAFVTVCFTPHELELVEFAAKECGQTKSSFIYVLVRNQLRAMSLLPQPTIPQFNGARHAP